MTTTQDPFLEGPSWSRLRRVLPVVTVGWLIGFAYLGLASRLPSIPALAPGGESVAAAGHFFASVILAILVYALIRSRRPEASPFVVAAAAIAVASLSGGLIELLQNVSPVRAPELVDWYYDGLGSLAGVALSMVVDFRRNMRAGLLAGASMLGAAAIVATAGAFFLWPPPSQAEVTTYCPPTVDRRSVPAVRLDPETGSRVESGLVVLYQFAHSSEDLSGVPPELDLDVSGGAELTSRGLTITDADGVARSPGPATKVHQSLASGNAFTIEAWVRTDDLLQRGPARIFSASEDTSFRGVSFHLGQERTCLSVRVRAGRGEADWLLVPDVFRTAQPVWHLAVTYEDGVVQAYVDGALRDEFTLDDASLEAWDPLLPLIVGNEATLDRAFLGEVFLAALFDRALSGSEIAQNFQAGPLPVTASSE